MRPSSPGGLGILAKGFGEGSGTFITGGWMGVGTLQKRDCISYWINMLGVNHITWDHNGIGTFRRDLLV
jgi:hypothetical protein